MIDVCDIADAAAKVLLDPSYAQKTFTPTGPASISCNEVAQAFTAALGRPVKTGAIPPEAVAENIRKMGWGEWAADVMRDYSAAYGKDWGDFVTDDVKNLTGHPARSIEQFVREIFALALAGSRQLSCWARGVGPVLISGLGCLPVEGAQVLVMSIFDDGE